MNKLSDEISGQLSEETANQLIEAFMKSSEMAKDIASNYTNTVELAINSIIINSLGEKLKSYYSFNRKYPFNRLKMIFWKKKAMQEIEALNKALKEAYYERSEIQLKQTDITKVKPIKPYKNH